MSGENSKTIGEVGEKITKKLLELIGWQASVYNLSIACTNPSHINTNGNPRISHGEDQIYCYDNPFHDNRTDIVHISVKNTEKYLAAQSLKSKLKKYFEDLYETIECSKNSEELYEITKNYGAKKIKFHNGLLICLQSNSDSFLENIISQIDNIRLDKHMEIPFYLIDNNRATFILKVIKDLQNKTLDSQFVMDFVYPNIGTRIGVDSAQVGKYLPLELIASDIIPAVLTKDDSVELILYSNEKFNKETYKILIAYALKIGAGMVRSIKIGLTDYNQSIHERDADTVKMSFKNHQIKISPFSFNYTIAQLLED